MKTINAQALPAPPSLIGCLMAGFDAITNHIGLILFPLALDLFLWFGPHLSLLQVVQGLVETFFSRSLLEGSDAEKILQITREGWLILAERSNLFAGLRAFPVGVPSMLASSVPIANPMGTPYTSELNSLGEVIGLWLVFVLVGLVVGTLYFSVVAQAAVAGEISWRHTIDRWPWASFQVVLLAIFWGALLVALTIPASCLITFSTLAGVPFSGVLLFLVGGLILWVFFPLLFSPHGIFVYQLKMFNSLREGYRLVRMTLPRTLLLFLMIFVINEGLMVLWRVPSESSWLALIGVTGHAFVATSLLAASFVYYRDAYRWLQRVLQQIKLANISAQ